MMFITTSLGLSLLSIFKSSVALSTTSHSDNLKGKIALKGLDASSFRHPLDRDLTSFIQNVPIVGLVEDAIRASFSLVEQGVRLDLLSSSVKISPYQMPELYKSMQYATEVLDMEVVPELFVQSSAQANAYTLALQGRDKSPPIVVVTSTLLDKCTDDEIQAIIGHELGHIKCSHSLYLTLGGLASTPFRGVPLAGTLANQLLQQWKLAAEYSCDRAALLVAQDLDVVAGAMLKLFAGTSRATNIRAFIEQAREYEKSLKTSNPMIQASTRMQQRTHPLPVQRVSELEKWANSDEYKAILESHA